jgi:hypothetical protein
MHNTKNKYARCTIYLGKINGNYKYETLYLHHFILNVKDKNINVVDHIDADRTLDNRKNNLRLTRYISITTSII